MHRTLIVTVATLIGVLGSARLGWWQLDRAAQKEALQRTFDARSAMPALRMTDIATTAGRAAEQYDRQVRVTGRWMPSATVFLDNRQMNGRVGFFVITPLLPSDGSPALLVQRGFTPRDNDDRERLPNIGALSDSALVQFVGRVAAPPARLYELGAGLPGAIRQNVEVTSFAKEIGRPLRPLTVVQDGPTVGLPDGGAIADHLLRQWARPTVGVQRHYGYAFQWFALCALMAGLYAWFQLVRPRLRVGI